MSEKPILFSGDMVRAILDGRKTQTRRVVKPQPQHGATTCEFNRGKIATYDDRPSGRFHILESPDGKTSPYGQPGDLLWVRETWCAPFLQEHVKPSEMLPSETIAYRADRVEYDRWIPSIYMPRWASRITLRVTNVRVERLQAISEDDAFSEGISGGDWLGDPVGTFRILWDSINAKRGYGWDTSPWVWVVGFELVGDETK